MTFHVGKRAVYPANWRWCVICLCWRPNKGAKLWPFRCAACIAKKEKAK